MKRWITDDYRKNPLEFYAVATDIESGEPIYHKCLSLDKNEMQWLRASASMPLAARIVEIDGKKLLDGGISDSVPIKFFEEFGYDRNSDTGRHRRDRSIRIDIVFLSLQSQKQEIYQKCYDTGDQRIGDVFHRLSDLSSS